MPRKPTDEELGKRVKELERQLADLKEMDSASKDYIAYQSVLAVLRGVSSEDTEESFLKTFLSEVVEKYGFCMSWYGRYEDGAIRPTLSAGKVDHYLDNLVLDIKEPTSPDAVCAISQAILKESPFSYGDLERDKGFRRWRDYALELGYRSNLAMPLRIDGRIEGGVMVYADTPNAFPKERMVRLMQLTEELGALLSDRRARLRADKTLQESEQNFRALAENANDGILIIAGEGIHIYANKKAAEITGYTVSELVGSTIKDLAPPQEFEALKERYGKIIEGQDFPVQNEFEFVQKNGKAVPLEVTSARTMWQGEPADLVIFRDITERIQAEEALRTAHEELELRVEERTAELLEANKQLEREITNREGVEKRLREREAYIKSLLQAAPIGIGLVKNRVLEWINDQMCEMLGYSEGELVGQSARVAYETDEEFERVGRVKYSQIHEGGMGTLETRFKRKEGSVLDVLLVSSAIDPADFSKGVIFTVMDITERKRAQDQLQWKGEVDAALAELFKPLSSQSISIEEMANAISDQAKKLTRSAHGFVTIIDPSTGDNIAVTLSEMISKQCTVAPGDQKIVFSQGDDGLYGGLWGCCLNTLEPFYTNSPTTHPASRGIPKGHIPIKSFLSVPVVLNQKLVGQISVANKQENYTDKDLKIISQIAEFYALAIQRKRGLDKLRKRESELTAKSKELEELNAALKILLKRRDEDRADLENSVVVNIKELVLPYIEKLKSDHLSPQQSTLVSIIESNIKEIVSPFAAKLSSKFLNLTPTELQVASLVKDGRSSNEIAELMNLSPNTILFHRYNLRRKLGLKQRKVNLRSYLRSLQY
jgi:PAS domain S-box-containing protein